MKSHFGTAELSRKLSSQMYKLRKLTLIIFCWWWKLWWTFLELWTGAGAADWVRITESVALEMDVVLLQELFDVHHGELIFIKFLKRQLLIPKFRTCKTLILNLKTLNRMFNLNMLIVDFVRRKNGFCTFLNQTPSWWRGPGDQWSQTFGSCSPITT